jgi:hypothetical protein
VFLSDSSSEEDQTEKEGKGTASTSSDGGKGLHLLLHRRCRLNSAKLRRQALPHAREASALLGASHLDAIVHRSSS